MCIFIIKKMYLPHTKCHLECNFKYLFIMFSFKGFGYYINFKNFKQNSTLQNVLQMLLFIC